jgi:hypothetical protein
MEEMMTDKRTSTATAAKAGAAKTSTARGAEQPGWAWPDIAGAQMNSVKALSDITQVFARTAQDLASQQTAFMQASVEKMQDAASVYNEADPSKRFARQSDLYRDIMERSVDHVSAVAETISGSCCEAMDQVAEAAIGSAHNVAPTSKTQHSPQQSPR